MSFILFLHLCTQAGLARKRAEAEEALRELRAELDGEDTDGIRQSAAGEQAAGRRVVGQQRTLRGGGGGGGLGRGGDNMAAASGARPPPPPFRACIHHLWP